MFRVYDSINQHYISMMTYYKILKTNVDVIASYIKAELQIVPYGSSIRNEAKRIEYKRLICYIEIREGSSSLLTKK